MKYAFMKMLTLSAALIATASIASAASTSITLDANSSLKKQGWEEVGIGGIHGLSKERTGRLEVESVTFEILK